MILLSTVSLLVGAALGQRFTVMVLMPATLIVLVLAIGTGVSQAHTAWWIVVMSAASATSMQMGYLIGIGIRHVLPATLSRRSSPLTSPTASMSARHPAR
jgi:membrane protein DedA with SNARE-associated domain